MIDDVTLARHTPHRPTTLRHCSYAVDPPVLFSSVLDSGQKIDANSMSHTSQPLPSTFVGMLVQKFLMPKNTTVPLFTRDADAGVLLLAGVDRAGCDDRRSD